MVQQKHTLFEQYKKGLLQNIKMRAIQLIKYTNLRFKSVRTGQQNNRDN